MSQKNYNQILINSLQTMSEVDPKYKPTNFWDHGLKQILRDFHGIGLEKFKQWPSAHYFFYPTYGIGFTNKSIDSVKTFLSTNYPQINTKNIPGLLNGNIYSKKEWDIARILWNQEALETDFKFGESLIGSPPSYYRYNGVSEPGVTKPFNNYLLLMALLSRHVDEFPRNFLELGGGFGSLADVIFGLSDETTYSSYDIPPLSTVSQYYLDHAHPKRDYLVGQSWEIPDHKKDVDVFVNSFSMQEMEPDVVKNYIDVVSKLKPKYIVSLNSRGGKPVAKNSEEIGVKKITTSKDIEKWFSKHGYKTLGTYDDPYQSSAATALIMALK